MSGVMYVCAFSVQEAEIKHWCFGECKKILFGVIADEVFGLLTTCLEPECPHSEIEVEDVGEVRGCSVTIRKLCKPEESE